MNLKQSSKLTRGIAHGVGLVFVVGLLAVRAGPGCVSPPDLVSWWSFEGSAADRAGLNTGRFITPYALSGGLAGSALGLDGAGGGMEVQDAASLNFGMGVDFSIEAWVRPEQAPTTFDLMDIVDKREVVNLADAKGYALYLEGGRVAVQISDRTSGGVLRTSGMGPDLRDGQWHHVAVTIQRNSTNGGRLYADGQVVLEFDPTSMAGDLSNNSPLLVGIHPAVGGHFKGLIDEVALFRRALSSDEVVSIYTAGAAGKCQTTTDQCATGIPGLVSWWRMESNVLDSAGTNHGSSDVLHYAAGKVNLAAEFVGERYIVVTNSPSLNPKGSFSIEAWVRPDTDHSGTIVGKWGGTWDYENQRSYYLGCVPDRGLLFGVADTAHQWDSEFHLFTVKNVLELQTWQHVVGVYDQPTGTRSLYVDGVKVAEHRGDPIFILEGIANVGIGANLQNSMTPEAFFQGGLDEVSFYDVALSPEQIKRLYSADSAGKCQRACASVENGLTSWWSFEGAGSDVIGTNTGTLHNEPGFAAGKVGQAVVLNGDNQYLRAPSSADLNPSGSFTIEGWINPARDQLGTIFGKWGGAADFENQRSYYFGLVPDRGLFFAISDEARQWDVDFHQFRVTEVVPMNEWSHVAAIYDQTTGTRQLFLNGTNVATRSDQPITILPGIADVGIGANILASSLPEAFFNGMLDEISFYDRALSVAELQRIYTAGTFGKCSSAPIITQQPTNIFAAVGGEILLSVEAKPEPLKYEWRKDGLPLAHQTNATLRIINALRAYSGEYDVLLYYPSTTLTSTLASVTVITPVTITGQPSGLELVAGANLLLSTTAEGEGPLSYQWYHNAVAIPDATNSTYAVSSAQPFHTGAYHVKVSNPASSVSSGMAQVVVYALPIVSIEPVSATIDEGDDFTFTGAVSGDPTFLRWEKDGLVLPETNTTLNIFAAKTTDAGVYTLTVSNLAGSASSSATLAVNKVEPVYVNVFANGTQVVGTNFVSPTPVVVSLTSVFPDANIYYTLNGAPASFLSTRYTGPLELQASATLRVRAYDKLFTQSGSAPAVNFVIVPNFTLSITNAGGGTVDTAPLNSTYPSNTVVTLTAVPSNGWTFLGWLGAAEGTNSVTQVVMNADKVVQPVFGAPIGHVITGNGTLEIAPPGPLYPYGTVVRLTAVPEDRNYLAIWGGSASGNANPLYLTVTNAGLEVGGLLAELPIDEVALTVLPRGFGTVKVSPTGSVFDAGSMVTLTAVPEPGQAFLGWAGDVATANTNSTTLTLTMDDDRVVHARFSANPVLNAMEPLGGLGTEGFTLLVRGEYGALYQVEASNDMSEWTGLGSISSPFGVSQITEPLFGTNQMRFYRAIKP